MNDSIRMLAALLASGSTDEKLSAAEKLAQLEDGARPAALALVAACETDDDELREWVVAALEGLGPPEMDDVPQLAALVERADLDVAYWAATLLGRLEAQAAPAVPQLAAALAAHPEISVRQRAAWALGKIGPPAAAARAALAEAAESGNARLASLAREALAQFGD